MNLKLIYDGKTETIVFCLFFLKDTVPLIFEKIVGAVKLINLNENDFGITQMT